MKTSYVLKGIAHIKIKKQINVIWIMIYLRFPKLLIEGRTKRFEELHMNVQNQLNWDGTEKSIWHVGIPARLESRLDLTHKMSTLCCEVAIFVNILNPWNTCNPIVSMPTQMIEKTNQVISLSEEQTKTISLSFHCYLLYMIRNGLEVRFTRNGEKRVKKEVLVIKSLDNRTIMQWKQINFQGMSPN